MNIVTAIGGINWGDVAFEPSLPVEDAAATIATSALAYTRAFGLAGRSANAMVMLPIVGGHLTGLYLGEHTVVDRFGLADPKFKVAMNLYGAPAMVPAEFAKYRPRLIVGASLTVMTPLGQVRSGEAGEPGHQSLVLQAGDRIVPHLRPVDGRGNGRDLALHRQHQFRRRTDAGAGRHRHPSGAPHLPLHPGDVAGR